MIETDKVINNIDISENEINVILEKLHENKPSNIEIENIFNLIPDNKDMMKIFVNSIKLNELWKNHYLYILKNFNESRFKNSYEDICNGKIKKLPIIYVINEHILIFENGRNRFYHLFKLGYKKIPIFIYKSDYMIFDIKKLIEMDFDL